MNRGFNHNTTSATDLKDAVSEEAHGGETKTEKLKPPCFL